MIFTDGSTSYTFSIQVVIFRDGTYLTLREVFESLDLTGYLFCPIFNIFDFLFMFLYYFCEDALHKHSSFVSTGTTWMWTFWMFMQTKAHFIVLISSIWSTTPVVKVGSGRFSLSRIILSKVYFVCWHTYYFLTKNWIRKPWLLTFEKLFLSSLKAFSWWVWSYIIFLLNRPFPCWADKASVLWSFRK